MKPDTRPLYRHAHAARAGFTLVELMVTLALAAVLGSLAAPSVRDFIVHSKLTNLGNEFTGTVLKARNEAVNRNTCVTLCTSNSADAAKPACTGGTDWQVGWIAFLNPTCDSGAMAPTDAINMLVARVATNADYKLEAQGKKIRLTFNARGAPAMADAEQFNLMYLKDSDPLTKKYAFNICLDGLGRTRTLPADKKCADYQ